MIYIHFYNDGYEIKGHANYAEYGNDIICSAISAISLSSIDWFEKSDILYLNVDEKKPIIKIKVLVNEKNELGLSLIYHQLKKVSDSYEKNIVFQKKNKKMEV